MACSPISCQLTMIPVFCFVSLATSFLSQDGRIALNPAMIVNETAFGDATLLVDEQTASTPAKPYFPGWTAWQYPMHIAIDLGTLHHVDKVSIYNESGENPIEISTGKPFNWTARKLSLAGYKTWGDFKLDSNTRWLRLTLTRPTSIPELAVYGQQLEKPTPKPAPKKPRQLPTVDELVGVNAFIDDPIDKIATPSGLVREYHTLTWDFEGSDALRRFQPSAAAGGNSWFFDDYYTKLKAAGTTVCPVVWQAPEQFFKTKRKEAKPVMTGNDTQDPRSYQFHGEHLFQFAARYGAKKVSDSLLALAPGQPRVSGLGVLRYIENWNEPDKTWEDREGRFNPYELAAMSSADYDGNQGKMGKNVGVKTADPSMKLVLGGLAGLDLPFLQAMKLWSDTYRNGSFPADAINLHHYSSTSNEQWFQAGSAGISPEADHLCDKISKIADWRDAAIPDRELWITEFGYDTNGKSPLHAPVIGSMSAEQVQGAWLVRAYMALAAARVDRAAMFMLRDVDSNGTGVFATCGLVSEKGKWVPKPSWYYQSALKSYLKGYRFSKILSKESDPAWQYEFDNNGKKAIVVWCPTSEDKHVKGFSLFVGSKPVQLVTLSATDAKGQVQILETASSKASFEVTETPKIVLVP